jgi:ABC-type polysaccharide/polyol phosphate transport system ATPase subunit
MNENTLNKIINRIEDKDFKVLNAKMKDGSDVFGSFNVENHTGSPSLVVYGDNVSGKSLIGKIIESVLRQDDIPVRNACVRNRTTGGIEKAMIYGDEGDQSTGATSLKVLQLCLRSSKQDSGESAMILDEADLGLSPKFSRALGEHVASEINESDPEKMIIIISHDADFLKSYVNKASGKVSSIGINTDKSLDAWINSDEVATIDELLGLKSLSMDKWRAINSKINEK